MVKFVKKKPRIPTLSVGNTAMELDMEEVIFSSNSEHHMKYFFRNLYGFIREPVLFDTKDETTTLKERTPCERVNTEERRNCPMYIREL